MNKENNYTVYKHTSPSGKIYIGLTCQTPEGRWGRDGHGYNTGYFRNAISKYGWDNILHEIVATDLSQEEAGSLEKALIQEYDARNPKKGYNLQAGGELGWKGLNHTDEAKEKIRQSKLGVKNPMYGKKQSVEWVEMIRRVNSHPKSAETIEKMRIAQSNRSEETRKKLSDSQKKDPVRCLDTGIEYDSLSSAARAVGASVSNMCACLKGRRKTCNGYRWEYIIPSQANTEVTTETKESVAL